MTKIPIVKMEDIIGTYCERWQKTARVYYNVMDYRKKTGFGKTKIAKQFNLKESCVEEWIYGNSRPQAIKIIENLKQLGLFPLFPSIQLARIVGYVIGDGHIRKNLTKTHFYGKYDMEEIKQFVKKYFKINGTTRPMKNGVVNLEISNSAFTRMLFCAGCPGGNKTKQVFTIPNWISYPEKYGCTKKESRDIQKAFLQSLNDSETTKLSLKKGYKNCVEEIKFEVYTYRFPEQLVFIKQLQKLLKFFSVDSIIFYYQRNTQSQNRWRIGIRIKNLGNIINFLLNVGFYFNKGRIIESSRVCSEICNKRLERIAKYEQALELLKNGETYESVSNKLNIPIGTVQGWYSRGRRPLSFKEKERMWNFLKKYNEI